MTLQAITAGSPYYRLDSTGSALQAEAAALRERGPATLVLLPGDVPAWAVTDQDLACRLLAGSDLSKDARRHWPAHINGEIPDTWPLRVWTDAVNALTAYGSDHTRLRRPLAQAFGPRRVSALVPDIETIIRQLLDALQTAGPEDVVDLKARFSGQLPLQVVNTLFHTPDHLRSAFSGAVGSLFATDAPPQEMAEAWRRVHDLITELIDYKRARPGDDLSTELIAARDAGDLTDQELHDSFLLVIGAGHETTVNALNHAVISLLTHPDQLALATTGQISWKQVVEESLRHQAPVASVVARFAVRDIADEITGLTFKQGDVVVMNYAAAGRDPRVHGDDADRFDVTRRSAHKHLSFGYGAHRCVGAALARIEVHIALQQLFGRFPRLRLAADRSELTPLPSFISNGHTSLPVLLGPTAP
ncbi:cytochrome P450 [Streptomyces sp. NPDC090493]|uniref:cytochrome P450 family protein n=1 Tax=Streptomyces sp. NPDC090493 TaxID=3365964 RepID=UPI00381012D6